MGLLSLTTFSGACGSSGSDGAGGTTGAAGHTGAAGTTGAAGATGAAGTTGAAGAGGSSSASSAACGAQCSAPTACQPFVIPSGLTTLTDFSSNLDAQGSFHASGDINDWAGLFGGTWVSPPVSDPCAATQSTSPLTQSFTGGNWHVTGTIMPSLWAGAGFWFATGDKCPVFDFSAYSGISFTIAGSAGPSGTVSVVLGTASNTAPNTDKTSKNFTCTSNAATCSTTTCTAASTTVTLSAAPQTIKLMFADLTGGAPMSSPDKKEITSIGINPNIDWSGKEAPYALDLTIDDLTLIP
jgi:hypothetical protein